MFRFFTFSLYKKLITIILGIRKTPILTVWVLSYFILKQGLVFAEEIINLTPIVTTTCRYDTNFWKTNEDHVEVSQLNLIPQILLNYDKSRLKTELYGNVGFYEYYKLSNEDSSQRNVSTYDYVGTSIDLDIEYEISDKIDAQLINRFYVTRNPEFTEKYNNSTDREKYSVNFFSPEILYKWSERYGVKLKYQNSIIEYENGINDSKENRGVVNVYSFLRKRSTIYLGYHFWDRNYDNDFSDYTSHFININYKRDWKKYEMILTGGYHMRNFDNMDSDDINLLSWKVQIGKKISYDASDENEFIVTFGQRINDVRVDNGYLTATYVDSILRYKLTNKLVGNLNIELQNSDYNNQNREDNLVSLSMLFEYAVSRRIVLGLQSGMDLRESNSDSNEYQNYFILANMVFTYDSI